MKSYANKCLIQIHHYIWIILLVCLFVSCSKDEEILSTVKEEVEICPKWIDGYPQVISGTTSLDITVELNKKGTVYYLVTSGELENKSAKNIKSLALSPKQGTTVRNGAIDVTDFNKEHIQNITGLPCDKTYHLYLVGGVDTLLMNDSQVVVVKKSLPKRQRAVALGTTVAPYGFYEYLPDEYYKKPNEKFPVVVFLHGSGEKGNGNENLELVLKHGPPKLINAGKDFPFIAISPQTSSSWNAATLNNLFEYIKSTYRVDESRIYLTGLSLGAMGTFSYALAYPDKLAAIVPIAGNANTSQACKIKSLPLWAFHNEGDERVLSSGSKNMVKAIEACGGSPLLTIYPVNGHDAWTATYDNLKMWEWFLKQVKK